MTISVRRFFEDTIRSLPQSFWVLWIASLVNRLGSFVQPFLGFYLTAVCHLSIKDTGAVMAVFGVGSLLSQPAAGWSADRFGRKGTVVGSMLACAAATLMLGYSRELPTIVVTVFVLGVATDGFRPAVRAIVADLVSPEERPRAYGLLFWSTNLGFAIAMLAGGWLASHDMTWLFWLDVATTLVAVSLVWRKIPETRVTSEVKGFGPALRDPVLMGFALLALVEGVMEMHMVTTLPLAMVAHGIPASTYGLIMTVNCLLVVAITPFTLRHLGRLDPSYALAAGFVLATIASCCLALASTPTLYLVGVVIWTFSELAMAGMAGTLVAAIAPADMRGRYNGIVGFAASLSAVLTPLTGAWLLELGHGTLWLTNAAVFLVAAMGQVALGPAVRRRTAALTGPQQVGV